MIYRLQINNYKLQLLSAMHFTAEADSYQELLWKCGFPVGHATKTMKVHWNFPQTTKMTGIVV